MRTFEHGLSVCAAVPFLLRPTCLHSIFNTVKAIMCAAIHSGNKIQLLHLQPQPETSAAI